MSLWVWRTVARVTAVGSLGCGCAYKCGCIHVGVDEYKCMFTHTQAGQNPNGGIWERPQVGREGRSEIQSKPHRMTEYGPCALGQVGVRIGHVSTDLRFLNGRTTPATLWSTCTARQPRAKLLYGGSRVSIWTSTDEKQFRRIVARCRQTPGRCRPMKSTDRCSNGAQHETEEKRRKVSSRVSPASCIWRKKPPICFCVRPWVAIKRCSSGRMGGAGVRRSGGLWHIEEMLQARLTDRDPHRRCWRRRQKNPK